MPQWPPCAGHNDEDVLGDFEGIALQGGMGGRMGPRGQAPTVRWLDWPGASLMLAQEAWEPSPWPPCSNSAHCVTNERGRGHPRGTRNKEHLLGTRGEAPERNAVNVSPRLRGHAQPPRHAARTAAGPREGPALERGNRLGPSAPKGVGLRKTLCPVEVCAAVYWAGRRECACRLGR